MQKCHHYIRCWDNDILTAGEIINVSLCDDLDAHNVRVQIFSPGGSQVHDQELNDDLLLGNTVVGLNQISWNGQNAAHNPIANGTCRAQLQLRFGEYYFIARDAETSGGPSADGLTIFLANNDDSSRFNVLIN